MEIKLREALPFIVSKEPVLEGTVEYENGAYVFTSKGGAFKQVLKKSEYDKMLEASGARPETPQLETKTTTTGNTARAGRPLQK